MFRLGASSSMGGVLEERRLLGLSPVLRHERIATLQALILRADFIDSGPHWRTTISAYRDEIRDLQAVLIL
jgi:hypothetical protein